jgi:DNA-binding CsgD family transcriptional regulator
MSTKRKSAAIRKAAQLRREMYVRPAGENAKKVARRKKRNAPTVGRKNHRKSWTEQEIAEIWRTDVTTKQIAELLGRSIGAVSAARQSFAIKMPESYVHNGVRREVFSACEVAPEAAGIFDDRICETGPCGGSEKCLSCECEAGQVSAT